MEYHVTKIKHFPLNNFYLVFFFKELIWRCLHLEGKKKLLEGDSKVTNFDCGMYKTGIVEDLKFHSEIRI